jgi:hypothetical protein
LTATRGSDRRLTVLGRLCIGGVVATLVFAGCGDGGGSDTQLDVAKFQGCFGFAGAKSGSGLQQSDDVDLIAQGAGVGAVQLSSDNQEIQVVAERTSGDAENTVSDYEAFGLGQVERFGTVVVAANNSMTDEELDPIKSCLSDQGIE